MPKILCKETCFVNGRYFEGGQYYNLAQVPNNHFEQTKTETKQSLKEACKQAVKMGIKIPPTPTLEQVQALIQQKEEQDGKQS